MRILVRQLGQGSAVPVTDGLGGNHRWPRWSPDGQRLVFLAATDSGAGVYVIPALGGPAKRVAEFPRGVEVYGVDWSPDGRRLAYVADRVIAVRSVEGGPVGVVAKGRDPHSVSWSPDGSHLAFTDGNASFVFGAAVLGNVSPTSIRVVPVAGGAPVAITDSAVLTVSPVWDPHGRGLFFVSSRGGARDIWFQPLDAARRPRGEPAQLTTGLQAHNVTVSGDGRRLLYSALSLQANIWRVPIPAPGRVATAAEATQVTTGSQAIEGLSVSRDGRWLAFDSDLFGNQDIYRIPATGGTAERLTDDPADDFIPVWSPDGRKIAFYSFRTGNRDIFVMAADGGGIEQVTREASHDRVPDWSPDGRSLVFFSDRTGRPELFVVTRTAEGGGWEPARQLTRDGGGNSRWSPRGAEIAYGGGFSVRVIPAEGGASRVVVAAADPGQDPAPHWIEWSPDARTIYFKTVGPQGRSAIFAVPAQGGTPRPVLVFPDPARQSPRTEFAVGPGYLYFTMGHHEGDIWALELAR
jgi:Tol biopolymer transport system component